MDTINKIMAAVDFTEYSEGLLNYAIRIAEGMNAELMVASIINVRDVEAISTVGTMGYEVDSEHYVSEIKAARLESLERILAKISYPADKGIVCLSYPFPRIPQFFLLIPASASPLFRIYLAI